MAQPNNEPAALADAVYLAGEALRDAVNQARRRGLRVYLQLADSHGAGSFAGPGGTHLEIEVAQPFHAPPILG